MSDYDMEPCNCGEYYCSGIRAKGERRRIVPQHIEGEGVCGEKIATLTRERDEARAEAERLIREKSEKPDPYWRGVCDRLRAELNAAIVRDEKAEAELARMRPVVEKARKWREVQFSGLTTTEWCEQLPAAERELYEALAAMDEKDGGGE